MDSPNKRWLILALVFAAAIINYLDRQIIAILKPVLQAEFDWSERDYAHIVSAFQFSAAAAYLGVGWFIDRTGLRHGYAWAVGLWSLAAAAHAAARTVLQFTVARVVLGVAEAVHTPAAVKAVAVWFPLHQERSVAIGIMASAANLGAIATPLLVPLLVIAFGWQGAFVLLGGIGFLWVLLWLCVREPTNVAMRQASAATSSSDPSVGWSTLLRDRATWAIAGAKFLFDQVWWFVLFWVPDFFHRVFHLDMQQAGPPLAFIYASAAVGSLIGGAVPSWLLARGVSLNAARKGTMLVCALIIVPIPLVLQLESYWHAAIAIGVALAAHQGFSTNVFALTTDVFPARVVGSVVSIGALFGNVGGMLMLEFTGWVLDTGGGYLPMFGFASGAYLFSLLWIHLLVPRLEMHVPQENAAPRVTPPV